MKEQEVRIISFLSFKLGKEVFATNVSLTNKILQLPEITKVPHAHNDMVGIINHHGNVLPVFDLSGKLDSKHKEYQKNTCVIILSGSEDNESSQFGLIVDEVLSVDEISESDILPPPNLGSSKKLSNIKGIFKKAEEFIMILNVEEIFKQINN